MRRPITSGPGGDGYGVLPQNMINIIENLEEQ